MGLRSSVHYDELKVQEWIIKGTKQWIFKEENHEKIDWNRTR